MIALARSALVLILLLAIPRTVLAQEGSPKEAPLTAAAMKKFGDLDAKFGKLRQKKAELAKTERDYKRAQKSGDLLTGQQLGRKGQELAKVVRALDAEIDGLIDPTRKAVEQAITADPKNVDLLLTLSKLAGLRGDAAAVLSAMDRAVAVRPTDIRLRLERGIYAYKAMDWPKAITDFEMCLKARGHPALVCRTNYVRSLIWTQQFERARKELELDVAREKEAHHRRSMEHLLRMVKDYEKFWPAEKKIREAEAKKDDLPRVKLTTTKGDILLELFENEAPNTVASFIKLVESGFYSGTRFHYRVAQYMVQGGCPHTRDSTNKELHGQGHPGYKIPDELPKKARLHFAGSLTMAKGRRRHTAGSQFMITYVPAGWLNVKRKPRQPPTGHTVFGRVIAGMDVAKKLAVGDVLKHAEVLRKRDHAYQIKRKTPVGR